MVFQRFCLGFLGFWLWEWILGFGKGFLVLEGDSWVWEGILGLGKGFLSLGKDSWVFSLSLKDRERKARRIPLSISLSLSLSFSLPLFLILSLSLSLFFCIHAYFSDFACICIAMVETSNTRDDTVPIFIFPPTPWNKLERRVTLFLPAWAPSYHPERHSGVNHIDSNSDTVRPKNVLKTTSSRVSFFKRFWIPK